MSEGVLERAPKIMATPSIAQHDDGDSEGDNDSILRSNRKKRTRKCLSSSDESEHSYNGFYKPSTPENKCYEYEKVNPN